jgi:hypothetical protein
MDETHFREYSFMDSQNNFHESLYSYCGTDEQIIFFYNNNPKTQGFFKFVHAKPRMCYFRGTISTRNNIRFSVNFFNICDASLGAYDDEFISRITSFKELMQSFYLQHEVLFDKMVEDYFGIKETVHPEMQKVYDDIINGVYEQKPPVIK